MHKKIEFILLKFYMLRDIYKNSRRFSRIKLSVELLLIMRNFVKYMEKNKKYAIKQ